MNYFPEKESGFVGNIQKESHSRSPIIADCVDTSRTVLQTPTSFLGLVEHGTSHYESSIEIPVQHMGLPATLEDNDIPDISVTMKKLGLILDDVVARAKIIKLAALSDPQGGLAKADVRSIYRKSQSAQLIDIPPIDSMPTEDVSNLHKETCSRLTPLREAVCQISGLVAWKLILKEEADARSIPSWLKFVSDLEAAERKPRGTNACCIPCSGILSSYRTRPFSNPRQPVESPCSDFSDNFWAFFDAIDLFQFYRNLNCAFYNPDGVDLNLKLTAEYMVEYLKPYLNKESKAKEQRELPAEEFLETIVKLMGAWGPIAVHEQQKDVIADRKACGNSMWYDNSKPHSQRSRRRSARLARVSYESKGPSSSHRVPVSDKHPESNLVKLEVGHEAPPLKGVSEENEDLMMPKRNCPKKNLSDKCPLKFNGSEEFAESDADDHFVLEAISALRMNDKSDNEAVERSREVGL